MSRSSALDLVSRCAEDFRRLNGLSDRIKERAERALADLDEYGITPEQAGLGPRALDPVAPAEARRRGEMYPEVVVDDPVRQMLRDWAQAIADREAAHRHARLVLDSVAAAGVDTDLSLPLAPAAPDRREHQDRILAAWEEVDRAQAKHDGARELLCAAVSGACLMNTATAVAKAMEVSPDTVQRLKQKAPDAPPCSLTQTLAAADQVQECAGELDEAVAELSWQMTQAVCRKVLSRSEIGALRGVDRRLVGRIIEV